jgi:hypothetical protein
MQLKALQGKVIKYNVVIIHYLVAEPKCSVPLNPTASTGHNSKLLSLAFQSKQLSP